MPDPIEYEHDNPTEGEGRRDEEGRTNGERRDNQDDQAARERQAQAEAQARDIRDAVNKIQQEQFLEDQRIKEEYEANERRGILPTPEDKQKYREAVNRLARQAGIASQGGFGRGGEGEGEAISAEEIRQMFRDKGSELAQRYQTDFAFRQLVDSQTPELRAGIQTMVNFMQSGTGMDMLRMNPLITKMMRQEWDRLKKEQWLREQFLDLAKESKPLGSPENQMASALLSYSSSEIQDPDLLREYQALITVYQHFSSLVQATELQQIVSTINMVKADHMNKILKVGSIADGVRTWDRHGSYKEFLGENAPKDMNGKDLTGFLYLKGRAKHFRKAEMENELIREDLTKRLLKTERYQSKITALKETKSAQELEAKTREYREFYEGQYELNLENKIEEIIDLSKKPNHETKSHGQAHHEAVEAMRKEWDEIEDKSKARAEEAIAVEAEEEVENQARAEVNEALWKKESDGGIRFLDASKDEKVLGDIDVDTLDSKDLAEIKRRREVTLGRVADFIREKGLLDGWRQDQLNKAGVASLPERDLNLDAMAKNLASEAQFGITFGEVTWRVLERAALLDGKNPDEGQILGSGENPLRRIMNTRKYITELNEDGKRPHIDDRIHEAFENPLRDPLSEFGDSFWLRQHPRVREWYIKMINSHRRDLGKDGPFKIDRYQRFMDLSECPVELIDFNVGLEIPNRGIFQPHYTNYVEFAEKVRTNHVVNVEGFACTPTLENFEKLMVDMQNARWETTAEREKLVMAAYKARQLAEEKGWNYERRPFLMTHEEASERVFRGLMQYWKDHDIIPNEAIVNAISKISNPASTHHINEEQADELKNEVYNPFIRDFVHRKSDFLHRGTRRSFLNREWPGKILRFVGYYKEMIRWGTGLWDIFKEYWKEVFKGKK